jgi:hypothetical protein
MEKSSHVLKEIRLPFFLEKSDFLALFSGSVFSEQATLFNEKPDG